MKLGDVQFGWVCFTLCIAIAAGTIIVLGAMGAIR